MVFSSPTFLFLFLPITLAVYHLIPVRSRFRNLWLLVASILFYYWGAGGAIGAIIFVGSFSWIGAYLTWRWVRSQPAPEGEKHKLRWPTWLTLFIVLGPLLTFKYIPQIATYDIPGLSGILDSLSASSWVLPLGVSFFTFHAVSFVIDSAREGRPIAKSFPSYLLYLFVFPHQIAGPIVRYSEIGAQIEAVRVVTTRAAAYGVSRFAWGLAKKVLIADNCGKIADAVFANASNETVLSAPGAWIGVLAYAMQIYFDFSGYSDMAIGLAALFGFRFPENFRSPYTSASISEFWRRWHITLTNWFRDYIYIPLGGNRRGPWIEYGGLLLVFTLTSLWHGALAGFLLWGALHGGAMLFERVTGIRKWHRFRAIRRLATFLFVILAWVPFRALTLGDTWAIWSALFAGPWDFTSPFVTASLTPMTVAALLVGLLSVLAPSTRTGFEIVFGRTAPETLDGFRWKVAAVAAPVLLLVAVCAVLLSDFSPFLYFQF